MTSTERVGVELRHRGKAVASRRAKRAHAPLRPRRGLKAIVTAESERK